MKKILFLLTAAIMALFSCGGSQDNNTDQKASSTTPEGVDSMRYGLACDGTNDSVIVFLPFVTGADPVIYNIEVAKANGKIIGQPAIGDWVGVMLNPQDTTEATMVINLDQLKATWTYQVLPTWKDASKLSRRALARKLNEIPDSLKKAYMVPRDYGFSLLRSSVAKSVGRVRRTSTLEDDSPVEYPKVRNYTGWKCRNGRLILISTDSPLPLTSNEKASVKDIKEHYDTLDFISMNMDSLVLITPKGRLSFKRKENFTSINENARKAAENTSKTLK